MLVLEREPRSENRSMCQLNLHTSSECMFIHLSLVEQSKTWNDYNMDLEPRLVSTRKNVENLKMKFPHFFLKIG
jgi:hypothetical protein